MNWLRNGLLLATFATAACGGTVDLTCDEVRTYQRAVERPHVRVPEDLDQLDGLREMAIPDVSPQAPRSDGSACIDRPPAARMSAG